MSGARGKQLRIVLVLAVFASLWVIGKATGAIDRLDVSTVRATVGAAGPWGFLIFIAAFTAGELLHVPGMIFVGAGILLYGKLAGFAISLVAAIVSVSVSFAVVRAVGGRALAEMDRPFVKRMLARLDARPVTTVAVLRAVFWLAPPLNYALALTSIRFRDYLLGSIFGLLPPILAAALLFDVVIAYIGA